MEHMKKEYETVCRVAMGVLAVLLSAGTLIGCTRTAEEKNGGVAASSVPVSPALQVIADQAGTTVALSAAAGSEIYLSVDAFAQAVNLPRAAVRSVTLLSLPDGMDGQILLSGARVEAGQRVPGDQLDFLRYLPNSTDPGKTDFTFLLNDGPTVYSCDLYLLSRENRPPEVSYATAASLQVLTYRDVSAFGKLVASDPEGDGIRFEIVERPVHGLVRLTDPTRGTYVYTPTQGYAGVDCFRYVARDKYGNTSPAVRVDLRIEKSAGGVVYTDLRGSEAENAALRLTASGIMSGRQVGGNYYFDPEGTVSRVDFLMMAMRAAGIDDVPAHASVSHFADEDLIPAEKLPFVSLAAERGYVTGNAVGGRICFDPDRAITRAEACVILASILDVSVPAYAENGDPEDVPDVPVFARASVSALHALGILPTDGGEENGNGARGNDPLTRADAARMLAVIR